MGLINIGTQVEKEKFVDDFLACERFHGMSVYHMVQMDKWNCLSRDGSMWDVPWGPNVSHSTDGMGRTSGTA